MKSHRIQLFIVLIFVVSLAPACSTTLTVSRFSGGSPAEGIVYFLPCAQFDITLTRELIKCDPVRRTVIISETLSDEESKERSGRKARVNGLEYGAVNVLVNTLATVTPRYIADPKHSYVIKYHTLNSPLKKTDIQVDLYGNGTLKTVNATIEDRSKEVITQVVKGITSIAMVTLPPARLVFPKLLEIRSGVEVTPLSLCTERISTALQRVERLRQEIRKVEAMVAESKDTTVRKESEGELQRLQREMSDARKPLTHVQHYTLTLAFSYEKPTFTVDRLALEPPTALRWFEQSAVKELSGKLTRGGLEKIIKTEKDRFKQWGLEQGKLKILDPESPSFYAEFPLKGKIDPSGRYPVALDVFANGLVEHRGPNHQSTTGELKEGDRRETPFPQGLVYRQPVEGDLMMCHEQSCLSETGKPQVPPETRLFSKSFLIPQAGILGNLPLHNGMFDRNTIMATFSEFGTLISLKYTTEAEAEKASASFAETVEALTKIRLETIKTETERLEAETKRLEAIKKREEAEKALKKALNRLEQE